MANIQRRQGKHGTSYLLRAYLGEDEHGKQIMRTKTWKPPSDMTERQAEKEALRQAVLFEEEARNGLTPLNSQIKFYEYAKIWMDTNEQAYTYRLRNEQMLKRINEAIGYLPLCRLQPRHLQAFYRNLAQNGKVSGYAVFFNLSEIMRQRGLSREKLGALAGVGALTVSAAANYKHVQIQSAEKIAQALDLPQKQLYEKHETTQGLSPKTILHHHELIRTILAQATREQIIPRNIARSEYMKAPKVRRQEAIYLNDAEAQEVVGCLIRETDIRVKTALFVLLFSGVRRGELCGLTWDSIDFTQNLIHVKKALQYQIGKGVTEVPTKTDSSIRPIHLPPTVMNILARYQNWWEKQREHNGDLWKGERGWLFIQSDGKPINPDTINYWLEKFIQ